MKLANLSLRRRLWIVLFLCAALGAAAQPASGQAPSQDPQNASKPVPPGRFAIADSAFEKLAAGKGYVTIDDAKELERFDKVFQASDANHDGRLDAAEFKKAWSDYSPGEIKQKSR